MTGDPLIRVRDLRKVYGSGEARAEVLRGLNLDLPKSSFTALLGRSGSGKSTFLLILGTLLRPTSGRLEMLGRELTHLSEAEVTEFRNRHIGFVFQFHHLLPDLTATENVMFPSAARLGRETGDARARARELLDRVGLGHRLDYRANALSGGQKQRVAIARALMNSPELVLADEPTGNLDRESAEQVMDLLHEINASDGMTFLISTHDEKIAARCESRVELDDGQIVATSGLPEPKIDDATAPA